MLVQLMGTKTIMNQTGGNGRSPGVSLLFASGEMTTLNLSRG